MPASPRPPWHECQIRHLFFHPLKKIRILLQKYLKNTFCGNFHACSDRRTLQHVGSNRVDRSSSSLVRSVPLSRALGNARERERGVEWTSPSRVAARYDRRNGRRANKLEKRVRGRRGPGGRERARGSECEGRGGPRGRARPRPRPRPPLTGADT